MFMKYYNNPPLIPIPDIMLPFTNLDYATLYYSKYVSTIFWCFLFFIASFFAIRVITSNQYLVRSLFYIYAALLLIAGVLMMYGYFVNHRLQDDEYTMSRWLMGIAQSPLICLILLASEKLYQKTISNDKKG